MDKNNKQVTNFLQDLGPETLDRLTTFAKEMDPSNLRAFTRPSPILTGDIQEIGLQKLDPRDIEKYLWMHPVVPRGIEIKANSMIRRGYTVRPSNDTPKAKKSSDSMNSLISNSGGVIAIKKWVEDGYGFGTGFKTLVLNKSGTRVLRLNAEHPIYFRITRYPDNHPDKNKKNKMIIDPRTKDPVSYNQVKWDHIYEKWIQLKPIKSNRVASLVFDTWGDEQVGISVVQYLHLTLKYLMNIEEAAAETLYRNGFVQKKVTTDINNERDLKKLAKSLALINRKDAIILPRGTDVVNLNPGTSDFPEFHPIFIKLLATRLGVPLPFLTQDGTQTNKATIQEMSKLMYEDFQADETVVEQTIMNQIFRPACRLEFGDDDSIIPIFEFNELDEDKAVRAERVVSESMAINNLINSAEKLVALGKQEESDILVKYAIESFNLKQRVELKEI